MSRYRGLSTSVRALSCALSLIAGMAAILATPSGAHAQGGPWMVPVSIEGEVRKPGTYTLPPGSAMSSLLYAAGGFTDNAYVRGAILTRASAREAQETELRKIAARISAGADGGTGAPGTPGIHRIASFLAALRPSGRLPVRLSHPRLLKGTAADIPLEEGDIVRIPAKTGTVGVTGSVRTADGAIPHAPKMSYKEYIRQAGGYGDDADREHVFLLRADGTVALLSLGFVAWNPAASRWEVTALSGGPPAVGPGDTIVVPRLPPGDLPAQIARDLPGTLMRATEIAGTPVILP